MKSVPIELSILNDILHNPITINNIPNIFIVLFVVLSCRVGMEAQHAAPLHALSIVHCPLMKSVPNEFSILNAFHLSIELTLRLYLFVLRLNVVMIDCFIVVCLHGGE